MKIEFPNEKGQSLIEVIIALTLAVIVILALVRVTITSIHNAAFARNRALATRYAQEWMEEARELRDDQDDVFFSANYCDDLNDNDPDGKGIFARNRDCTFDEDKTMTVEVTVSWSDAAGTHNSNLETRLTNWK